MNKQSVNVAVAPIHNKPNFNSEMITQCLMWEAVEITTKHNDWFKIETVDGYYGWIHTFYLSEIDYSCDRFLTVYDRFLPIYSNESLDSEIISVLSFGTKVPVLSKNKNGFFELSTSSKYFIYTNFDKNIDLNGRMAIVRLAKTLLGVPYIWGGKSSFGFDCSGFVQLLFNSCNIILPRDSSSQYILKSLKTIPCNESLPGDLIFFFEGKNVNHVGIIIDKNIFIHCSGKVKIESLLESSSLYNHKLAKSAFKVKSIKKLL